MVNEENRILDVRSHGFLKISRIVLGRISWWRKNKLFQIKAHPMVHTGCPGKFVFTSNFAPEVSPETGLFLGSALVH